MPEQRYVCVCVCVCVCVFGGLNVCAGSDIQFPISVLCL